MAPSSHNPPPDLSIRKHFRKLKDPRRSHRRLHLLQDVLVIALCAVIAGAQDWQDIETFGRKRRDWLSRFLELPHGIPSHDTSERVFDRLDPPAFQACFRDWVRAVREALRIKHVAIDGKTLRGSGTAKLGPLHLVSAWATAQGPSLGRVAVDAKSNEITAIPALPELLDLGGALVTIDAMGCQRAIAAKVIDRGGDYILTVKDNQEHLLEDVERSVARAFDTNFAGLEHDTYETRERGHGREEYRSYTVIHGAAGLRNAADWAGLTTIGMCYSERTVGGVTTEESRYFIGSRKAGARTYGQALRGHWRIENSLHWQLDVYNIIYMLIGVGTWGRPHGRCTAAGDGANGDGKGHVSPQRRRVGDARPGVSHARTEGGFEQGLFGGGGGGRLQAGDSPGAGRAEAAGCGSRSPAERRGRRPSHSGERVV